VDFRHKNTEQFFDYWLSLSKKRLIPMRSSFHPEDVPSLLPNMMIYELVSENYIKLRLLGSNLDERFGETSDDGNYLDYVERTRRSKASEAIWAVANQPCGMQVITEQPLKSGLTVIVETLSLPLRDDNHGNPQLIIQKNVLNGPDYEPQYVVQPLEYNRIIQRDFIDIGGGIPDFTD